VIVTDRLCLRPFRAADLPAFVAYRSAPEVARYQSWDTTFSQVDAERGVCGDCAVNVLADQPATAEVGVTFAPERQGSGLAGEALAAVITRLFAEHGLHRVYAEADDRNTAVHRLLERLGLRCEARLVEADWFKDEWTTLRTYAVLRREWELRHPA